MTLKQSALAAALGGALAVAPPAPAAFPVPPVRVAPALAPTVPSVPVTADAAADVTALQADVKKLQEQVKKLTELVEGKKDGTGAADPIYRPLRDEVFDLKNKVAALEKQIEEMKKSTSLRPSTGGPSAPADLLAGKGTVRVVNDYPIEITMAVNSNTYRIAPSTKVDIPIPAGEFTYQLLTGGTSLAPVRSAIKEKEVVTLRIKETK